VAVGDRVNLVCPTGTLVQLRRIDGTEEAATLAALDSAECLNHTGKPARMRRAAAQQQRGMKVLLQAGDGVDDDGFPVACCSDLRNLPDGNIADMAYVRELSAAEGHQGALTGLASFRAP